MHALRYSTLIALAAVISCAVACKTTSTTTKESKPGAEQAAQNVEQPAEEDATDEQDTAGQPEKETAKETESAPKSEDGPQVIPLETTVDGDVDEKIIRRVFESHRGEMVFCYEEALEESPQTAGFLTLEFDISSDGRAENVEAEQAQLDSPEMATCVRKRVEQWGFPKPADAEAAQVRARFAFQSPAKKVMGSLLKDDIRAVIEKNRNQIRYCYEKELVNDKDLAGQVMMKVTIGKTGEVIAANTKSTTLNNEAVERCMATAMREWTFPAPEGGGIVIVNYPFNFSSGSSDE